MENLSRSQQKKQKRREKWVAKRLEARKLKKTKRDKTTLFHRDRDEWTSRKLQALKVVIDCSFGSLMTDREKSSLKQQLMFSYAANKKSDEPLNISITGLSEDLLSALQSVSSDNWFIEIHQTHYLDLFDKEKLVYLTADSPNELETFSPEDIYIIGGLVDHNRLKWVTVDKANQEEIRTAKFPLENYVVLKSSTVLAVNHCVDILLHFQKTSDWETSFLSSIPSRKKLN